VTVRRGEAWGRPAAAPADREVAGDDRDLAACVHAAPGALVRFVPTPASDLARAVGLTAGAPAAGTELPMDALVLDDGTVAVNAVVLGTAPDRLGRFARATEVRVAVDGAEWCTGTATTVVCLTGQWLHGHDAAPRGHPGDGRAEIQVYRLRRGERRAMRRRLGAGEHVPHPRIGQRTARRVEVASARPLPLEVDGRARPAVARLTVTVRPAAYRLLV
jgi:hypothetical protein